MAQADLEPAVIKSIVHARLSLDEVIALMDSTPSLIMEEFGLTYGEVERVNNWMKIEAQRLIYEEQLQRVPLQERRARKLSARALRKFVLQESKRR